MDGDIRMTGDEMAMGTAHATYRLLKSVTAMINWLATYLLAMLRHCDKTAFIAEGLFIINTGFPA